MKTGLSPQFYQKQEGRNPLLLPEQCRPIDYKPPNPCAPAPALAPPESLSLGRILPPGCILGWDCSKIRLDFHLSQLILSVHS